MSKFIRLDRKGYGTVQRDFMKMNISVYAKCVYCLLRTYTGDKNGCFPSLSTITEDLNVSKNTVIKAIKELESVEMVAVRRSKKEGSNQNMTNVYIPVYLTDEIDLNSKEGMEYIVRHMNQDSSPHEPQVVHEVNSNNNSYNNNKEDKESKDSYVDISSNLFGEEDSIIKQPKEKEGKEKSSAKKEKAAEFTTFHFKQALVEMGADSEHVDDWISVRKAKKGSNTRTALKGFISACTKAGISVAEGVRKCAEKSWCSLDASWITPNEPKKEELNNQRTINM